MDAAAEPYVYEYVVPLTYPASQEAAFKALVDPDALKVMAVSIRQWKR